MNANNVDFGTTIVTFKQDGKRYIRLNISRAVVNREDDEVVFANVETGKIRIVHKDEQCEVVATVVKATSAAVQA